MKYPWIAEAIIEWKSGICKHKGDVLFCKDCNLDGKICEKLSELAKDINDKIKEED